MLHHFPVFLFLPLCLIRWWLLGAATDARAPGTVSSPTWLGGLGLYLLLLKIIEVTSEGHSSTPGSLLDFPLVVSSTRGHHSWIMWCTHMRAHTLMCVCSLSPCLMSARC